METRRRSVVKAVIWNGIGFTVVTTAIHIATGSAGLGSGMALVPTALGLATYLISERLWAGASRGRHNG